MSDVRADAPFYDINADGLVDAEDVYRWHELESVGSAAAELSGDLSVDDTDRALIVRAARRDEASSTEVRP